MHNCPNYDLESQNKQDTSQFRHQMHMNKRHSDRSDDASKRRYDHPHYLSLDMGRAPYQMISGDLHKLLFLFFHILMKIISFLALTLEIFSREHRR